MLPIVHRELSVEARNPKLYQARFRLGLLAIVGAAGLLLASRPGRGTPGAFFWFLSWSALLFCLLEGVRKTADAISEERREGTLGFLFLTELSGLDVVLGKFSAAAIRSLNGLFAFIPVLSITLLMGGTTSGEFWRSSLVLILALATSLSVCLAVSATRREGSGTACLAALAIICFLPPGLGEFLHAANLISDPRILHAASPAFLLGIASDASHLLFPRAFWMGVAIQLAIIATTIGFASFVTRRAWQDKPVRPGKPQKPPKPRSQGRAEERRVRRRLRLDRNPIYWLTYHEAHHRRFSILFMGIAALLAAVLLILLLEGGVGTETFAISSMAIFVLVILLALQLASQASMNLAEARRNGTLELLLSTPLKVRDIIEGQWLALRKMFLPAALVIAAFGAYLWIFAAASLSFGHVFWFGKLTLELGFEFLVLGWVGMWSGLVAKTPNRALFRTLILGIILPYFVCTPTLLNQLILWAVARDMVKAQFRRFVAERYLQGPKFFLQVPGQRTAPPLIR